MDKVVVLGASGLLGHSLVPYLRRLGYLVICGGRNHASDYMLDFMSRQAFATLLHEVEPNYVVNLVGATDVDRCESDIDYAYNANVEVVANVVSALSACRQQAMHLVHVSTDQVYDGPGPHIEDEVRPINVYALSKYTGELLAERVGATVLRSNFFGRSRCAKRISFSDWVVNSLRERMQITVFDDVKFSALHIDTLCSIIARSIERRPSGIFNAGCRDWISKAGFALSLARALGLSTNHVRVGTSADLTLRARRPLNMTMQVARLEAALGFQCPVISREIEQTVKEYLND